MRKSIVVLVGVFFALSLTASAASIVDLTGTQVTINSSFDGGPIQTLTVTYGAGPEVTSSTVDAFSWLSPGDSIDLFFDGRNELTVNFSSADSFTSAEDISLDVQLLGGPAYGPIALIKAIDVTVPSANLVSDSDLTFDMQGLDQIQGFGGQVQYTFFGADTSQFVDPSQVETPEPSTIWLFAAGGLGLLRRLRR
jgi:hypothetical protein